MRQVVLLGWFFLAFVKAGYSGGPIQVGPFTTRVECEQEEDALHRKESMTFTVTILLPCRERQS